ncbi:hypothetical protein CASFOL_027865 [Castilleja foliolosa]|uniref:X8 domain-containing protein n=1 Tax=Castilleja foliolosa TaxID=1961234 RepID=A0ABD3CHV3_9LAMI
MAKFVLVSFSLLLISLSSVCYQGLATDEVNKYYCVAKPSSSDDALKANIKYVCEDQNLNCTAIKEVGSCYKPITLINHASVAMNIYYQAFNRNTHNCDFQKSGLITITEPTYDNCKYY